MTYQEGPLTNEIIFFFPLIEGTFPLLNVVQFQFAPER